MRFLKKYKGRAAALVFTAVVLTVAFFCGSGRSVTTENAADKKTPACESKVQPKNLHTDFEQTLTEKNSASELPEGAQAANRQDEVKACENPVTEDDNKARENTEYAEQSAPLQKKANPENGELICSLSVRCDNAVGKSEEKAAVIPENGIIFAERPVTFNDGESVFDVLVREMKNNKIHLEFVKTPIYNSSYIEGINNLYEFDCGELSGWMYSVNGVFPNYGCSEYILKQGDKVEWVYTCDSGKDVDGKYYGGEGEK